MKSIVQSYIEHKGWCCNNTVDESVLTPFFLADSAYLVYNDRIKPLPLKREMKMYAKKFIECYREFNKDFFAAFDDEQKDYVIDKMDALHEAIGHDVEIFRMSIINHLAQFPTEVRQNVASFSACLHLTSCAFLTWRTVFRNGHSNGEAMHNRALQGMLSSADMMFKAYTRQKAHSTSVIDLNKIPDIEKSSRIVCNRIIQFIDAIRDGSKDEV